MANWYQKFIGKDSVSVAVVKPASSSAAATDEQVVVGLHPSSLLPGNNRPDNYYRVAMDPTQLLYDSWDTLDTTDKWTISGTTSPAVSLGVLTLAPGTAASAWSAIVSKATFQPLGNMYHQGAFIAKFDATLKTGCYRFMGYLPSSIGTPTAAAPITDGVGFEYIDSTGDLNGVVWSGGVKTASISLTALRPSDGNNHRYSVYWKNSRAYFEIDGTVASTSTIANPAPNISTFALGMIAVNGLSVLGSGAVMTSTNVNIGDSGRNNHTLSDFRFPWRRSVIKAPSVAAAATDEAIVVSISPNSPARHIAKPDDYGALGAYRFSTVTGTLAAALAAGAVVFSARWSDATRLCVIKSLKLSFLPLTPFTAATLSDYGSFDASIGRSFSAAHTGGTALTLTSPAFKTRANMAATLFNDIRVATTAALAGGTVTVDATPFAQTLIKANRINPATGTEEVVMPTNNGLDLSFNTASGEAPIVLAQNEGIVVRNRTVWPAAGTGILMISMSWSEVTLY